MAKQIVTREVEDGPQSKQGEEQAARRAILWASASETEQWVADALQNHPYRMVCKRRGRHNYADMGMRFVGITRDGLWVRRAPCHDCHAPDQEVQVERVELWDVRQHKGKITSSTLVAAYPNYLDPDYLNTGNGRMKPRGIVSAEMTLGLRGVGYRDFRKNIILVAVADASAAGVVEDEPAAEHSEVATA